MADATAPTVAANDKATAEVKARSHTSNGRVTRVLVEITGYTAFVSGKRVVADCVAFKHPNSGHQFANVTTEEVPDDAFFALLGRTLWNMTWSEATPRS